MISAGSTKRGSSGSTIPIYAIGTFKATTQGLALPDVQAAFQSRIDEANAAGGINGHQIKLTVCDDKGSPNQTVSCARDAVSGHAVAVPCFISLSSSSTSSVTSASCLAWSAAASA